jgi:DNA polymerase-3 subunit gamma/tau
MLKKAAKPLNAPTGQRIAPQTYQIKASLAPKADASAESASGGNAETAPLEGPTDAVSNEALRLAWKQFADDHMADGPRSLYTTLTAELPEVSGNDIAFKVHNSIQEKDLQEIRGELMEHLRKRLNNVALQLHIERIKEQEVKKEFLSEREKYDRLAAKNPLLDELRKRLDLDLS